MQLNMNEVHIKSKRFAYLLMMILEMVEKWQRNWTASSSLDITQYQMDEYKGQLVPLGLFSILITSQNI